MFAVLPQNNKRAWAPVYRTHPHNAPILPIQSINNQKMGCCFSKQDKKVPHVPPIVRSPGGKASERELPFGVILTGGQKLRENGLDGTGVRVAVIDSGIDETHPGFSGKVTRKIWYRFGSPVRIVLFVCLFVSVCFSSLFCCIVSNGPIRAQSSRRTTMAPTLREQFI